MTALKKIHRTDLIFFHITEFLEDFVIISHKFFFYLFKFPAIRHCGNHLSEFFFLALQHPVHVFDWHLQEETEDGQNNLEFTMYVTCLKSPFFFRKGKQHHLEPQNLICSESPCRRLNASRMFLELRVLLNSYNKIIFRLAYRSMW